MTLQILNGYLDPNWVLVLMTGVVGFLLVRILNRIEKRLEVHDNKLNEQDKEIVAIKTELKLSKE